MRSIITDFILTMVLATALIVFGTNAVTTEYNIWALIAKFGGAL